MRKAFSIVSAVMVFGGLIVGGAYWYKSLLPKEISAVRVYTGQVDLFDPKTGEPLVYYDKDEDDFCVFWDNPGASQKTGNELLPLTKEALNVCREKVRQEEKRIAEQKRLEEEKRQVEEKEKEEKRLAEEKARLETEKKKKEEELEKHHTLGHKACKNGQYEVAAENYSRALAIDPNDVRVLKDRCNVLITLKKYNEAVQDCDKALFLNPDADAFSHKCFALWQAEKYTEAAQCYDRMVIYYQESSEAEKSKINLETIKEWMRQIEEKVAEEENKKRKLEAAARKAAEKERQRLEAKQKRIEKEKREAEEKERKKIEAEQKKIERERRKAEEAQKRAEARAREAERRKHQTGACNSKGYDFYSAGNYEEAIKWFDNALVWNPKNVYALFNRCLALRMLKRYDEALASCDQALSVNSDCMYTGGDENKCFNREKIAKAREETENEKRLKEKVVNVIVIDSNWNYGSNWFEFNLRERNDVTAVFNRAEIRIWKMQSDREPPASFKQREPLYWSITIPSITVWPSQPYCGNFSKPHSGGYLKYCEWTNEPPCNRDCILSLKQYRNWLQEIEWIEATLFGQDENGHSVSVTLEAYDS